MESQKKTVPGDADEEFLKMNRDLLGLLKCLGCEEYMKPPIYQCRKGHSVCEDCHIDCCPDVTCSASIIGTRNYTVERITEHLLYPCINQDCRVYAPLSTDHSIKCIHRKFSCPLIWCDFVGNYGHLKDHLMEQHSEKTTVRETDSFTIAYYKFLHNLKFSSFLIAYDMVFEMRYQHVCDGGSKKLHWDCYAIDIGDKNKFHFEVQLHLDGTRRLNIIAPCRYNKVEGEHSLALDEVTLRNIIKSERDLTFQVTILKNDEL